LDGLSVVLIDTAGQRVPVDALEAQAILRASEQARLADLQLLVIDASVSTQSLPPLAEGIETVVALNKADLNGFSAKNVPAQLAHWPCVKTSALTSQGRKDFIAALLKALNCHKLRDGAAVVFTERQRKCLSRADEALKAAGEPDLRVVKKALTECLGMASSPDIS
jgi:tRNA U34 5-carboxymethylaminomethyl modifying GTPase MnmE/TrmE